MTTTTRYGLGEPNDTTQPMQNNDPLRRAFEEWSALPVTAVYTALVASRRGDPETREVVYQRARSCLGDIRPHPDEAEALVASDAGNRCRRAAGLFLSAVYNASERPFVLYHGMVDEPLDDIGYRLPNPTTLVIAPNAMVGEVGLNSEGPLLICGSAKNVGNEDDSFVPITSRSVVVSGRAENLYGHQSQITIVTGDASNSAFGLSLQKPSSRSFGEITYVPDFRKHKRTTSGAEIFPLSGFSMLKVKHSESGVRVLRTDKFTSYLSEAGHPYRASPELDAYIADRLRPFTPGTPWEDQLVALRALDQSILLEEIESKLAKLRTDWPRHLRENTQRAETAILNALAKLRHRRPP